MIRRWPLVEPESIASTTLLVVAIDHRHDRAVLAGDVDEAVGPELERMRRDIGQQIDGGDVGALVQIEHAEQMLRIGIAAVDAVAEDRHIGHAGLRHDEQFMHGLGKAVDHDLGLVGGGIEEQHLRRPSCRPRSCRCSCASAIVAFLATVIPGPSSPKRWSPEVRYPSSCVDNDSGLQERHYQWLWIPGSRLRRVPE